MAVSWGAWEYGSGNGMRVGVEATAEAVSHGEAACTITVDYWTDNQYTFGDTQTMNFGGSIGGSSTFTNNDSPTAVKRFTKTYTYTYSGSSYGSSPGTRTFSCSISGAYNGITPSASDTVSLPARPYASPAATTGGTITRVSDETNKISWVNHPTAGEPYNENTRIDRYIYSYGSYAGQEWNTVAYVSPSSTTWSDAGAIPNRKWYYRIYARNSVGTSAGDYTNVLYTAPATPTACARAGTTGNQVITWTNNVYYSEATTEVWHAANGVWDASPLTTVAVSTPGSTGTYTHVAPSAAIKHKYKVRTKTTSGTVLYSSYSGETTETAGSTTAPNAPTGLAPATPTVADRDASIVFTWTHNKSTDGSAQTAFSLQHREVGNSTWTVVPKTTSTASNYTLAHSYGYSTEIEWQVQTWGADPAASPFSAIAQFFTSEPVPRRYPMYLDVTSGRVEADSTPDSGGGGISWGSWNSISRHANWSAGTIRYRRSMDGSLVELNILSLQIATEQDTNASGNLSPDLIICTLPEDAWPDSAAPNTFTMVCSGAYMLICAVGTTGIVMCYGSNLDTLPLATSYTCHGNIVYGAPSTGGGSLGLAPLVVQEEGSPVMPGTTTLNFIGAGVTATSAGAGAANVTISGGAPQAHSHVEADLPTTLATDTEVATAVTSHAAAADPHTGYQKESEKAAVNGYASLDGTTKVPIAQVPTGTSGTTVSLGNHGHALTDANVTGVLPIAQVPTGQTGTTVPFGNDARFTDARTPTAHVHTITDLPVAPSGTSNTTQVVRADDSRLSNARTPSAHVHAAADTTSGSFVVDRLGATPAATTYLKGAATAGTATWVVPTTMKTDLALVKGDVGLGSVDNTADTAKPVSTAQQTALNAKANTSHTHVATTDLTATGTKDTTTFLRGDNTWGVPPGTGAVSLGPSVGTTTYGLTKADGSLTTVARSDHTHGTPALGTTSTTAAAGDHAHALTAASITGVLPTSKGGLGVASGVTQGGVMYGVDSTQAQTTAAGTSGQYLKSAGSAAPVWTTLTKTDVGLANVDNTTDAAKPVSTAQATAIGLKATDTAVVHLAGTETVTGLKTFTSAIGMSEQVSTPTTPASGFARIYAKTDGLPYYLGDDGVERQLISPVSALHSNPGFEGAWANSSTGTPVVVGLCPPNWSYFWCSDGVTAAQETVDKTEGAYAVAITKPSGVANCRIHSTSVFPCNPGDTIDFEIDVKSTVNATYNTGFLSASTQAGCDFFSGDPLLSSVERAHALTGAASYKRVRASWTVPTGCYWGRFSMTYAPTGGVTGTLRIDNSSSTQTVAPGGGGGPEIYDEGAPVVTDALGLNFVGAGVTATNDGVGNATVTIPGNGFVVVATRQVFTATGSQTWTKPANFVYAEVEVQGAGGGGSGVANSGATTANAGGSGGGGGYTKKVWLDVQLNATETVVVGAGGTAGPANDTGGGTGGASSFKTTQIGNGGTGGAASGAVTLAHANGGTGASGTGGDYTIAGGDGPSGMVHPNSGGTAPVVQAVSGGASFLAGAGRPVTSAAGGVGVVGQNFGGGGGGGYSRAATGAFAGGVGAAGVVIVTSYVTTSSATSNLTGQIIEWPLTAVPSGYLACNGATYLDATYPVLATMLKSEPGNVYYVSATQFKVPDLKSRFPIGAGTFGAIGASDALAEASRTPTHTHGLNGHSHNITGQSTSIFYEVSQTTGGVNVARQSELSGHSHGGATGTNSNPTAANAANSIPYFAVNFCIKT